jgi:hypothetical protein
MATASAALGAGLGGTDLSAPFISASTTPAGGVSGAMAGQKRKMDGYGTASGAYRRPYPKVKVWHVNFATPKGGFKGNTATFEVDLPENMVGR